MAAIEYVNEARVYHKPTLSEALELSLNRFDVVCIDLDVFFDDVGGRGMNYLTHHDPALAKFRLVGRADEKNSKFTKKIRAELAMSMVKADFVPRPPRELRDDQEALTTWLVEKVPFYSFDEVSDTLPLNSVIITTELVSRCELLLKSKTLTYFKIGKQGEPTNNLRLDALRPFYDKTFSYFMSKYKIEPAYHYAPTFAEAIDLAAGLSDAILGDFKIILDIGDIDDLHVEEILDPESGKKLFRWTYRMREEPGYRKVDVETDMEMITIEQEGESDLDVGILVTNDLPRTIKHLNKTKGLDYLESAKSEGIALAVAFGHDGLSNIDQEEDKYMSISLLGAILLKTYDDEIHG